MAIIWLAWDWKESLNISGLNEALAKVYDGKHVPCVVEVPDTGMDSYFAAVSSEPIGGEAMQEAFNKMIEEEGG